MLLAIDAGNTSIVFALINNGIVFKTCRLNTDINKSYDEYYLLIKDFISGTIDDAILSSVVPSINSILETMLIKHYNIKLKIVGKNLKTGLKIIADDPKTVGADLICGVIGATNYYDEGLVIDLGTASKIIYYKNNTFIGCLIAPGVKTTMKALSNSAALLSQFDLSIPNKILNNSTIPCMQSGVIYGFAGMIEGLVSRIKKEINNEDIPLICTGGLASLIIPLCNFKTNIIDDNLIIQGLYNIYMKNK